MKIINFSLTLFFIFFFSLISFAQDEVQNPLRKGRILSDADIGFKFSSSDLLIDGQTEDIESSISEIDVVFDIGYTVMDNFLVGLEFDVDTENSDTDIKAGTAGSPVDYTITSNVKLNTYSLFAKYYFLNNNFRPFLGVNAGIAKYTTEDNNTSFPAGDNEYEGSGIEFGIRLGFTHFINDHIGFNVLYKMDFLELDNTNTTSGGAFDSTSSFKESNILLGFTVAI